MNNSNNKNILFLRRTNFEKNGNLNIRGFLKKLVITFVHADYCGYCHQAYPEFVKAATYFASDDSVIFSAGKIDGPVPGEKEIREVLPKVLIKFQGVPDYAFFYNNTPLKEKIKGRSAADIISTINSLKKKYKIK